VRCLAIDPISALAKAGNEDAAYSVAERLIDWTKEMGITLLCTSLLHDAGADVEGTPLQVSTIADTWIHLNHLVRAGERNRGLSIIKSRGTAHSNQVRELILSAEGVTVADAYTAGGEVLMGTLRWEKERAVQMARDEFEEETKRKLAVLENEKPNSNCESKRTDCNWSRSERKNWPWPTSVRTTRRNRPRVRTRSGNCEKRTRHEHHPAL
jgi:circadian clock protein KaiC